MADRQKDKAAIAALVANWAAKTSSSDVEALAAMVTGDARFLQPAGPAIAGPDGIRAAYRSLCAR